MDSLQAFAKGEANRGKEMMVFDWNKAAELIKERQPKIAAAGLAGDWEWTGGNIWEDGAPSDDYTYLASTWAMPEIELDGARQACFAMESTTPGYNGTAASGWNAQTKWPDSALEILGIAASV